MEFETLSFDVDGVSTVVKAIGKGPAVIARHGAATLEGQQGARALADRFRVYLSFHPGFGESGPAPHVRGMQDLVVHYLHLLPALGVDRPHLVGHSMGGWMATEIAVVAGERFNRLVLNAPVGLNHPIIRWQISPRSRRRNFPGISRTTSMLRSNIFRAAPKLRHLKSSAPRVNARTKR
jgi:pimeloyl-ACP methyl ester carboxylesterase